MRPKDRRPPVTSPRGRAAAHPDLDALLASIAGELSGAAAKALEAHAAGCPPCRERLRALALVVQAASTGALEPIPDDLRREANRIFTTWRRREEGETFADNGFVRDRAIGSPERGKSSGWGTLRMRVAPSFASWPPVSHAAGFRSASAPPRCELEGGGYRIELEWTPSGRLCAVRGQIVRERDDADLQTLELEFDGGRRHRVVPNARGFFGPIAAPRTRVRIVLDTAPKAYRSRWLELT